MICSRFGPLGLCLLAAGVMAFFASVAQAQAEEGANWLILTSGGVTKIGGELSAAVLSTLENNDASLLTKIVGIKTKILCTAGTLVGVKLESEGKIANGGKANFTGCVTYLNEELAPECTPKSPGAALETIEINAIKGELVLHEPSAGVKEGVIKVEPKEGETFVTLEVGAACPIGVKIPLIGKLFLKESEGKFTTHLVKHLFEELKALTTLWAISKTTEHVSTADGSATVFLSGAHNGLGWGGMPARITEAGGKWLILNLSGIAKTAEELPAEVTGSLENNDGSLLSKVIGTKYKLLCTAATLVGMKLEGEGKITSGSKVKFSGCASYFGEERAPECDPKTSGAPLGTIETTGLKGETRIDEPSTGVKESVVRIEPKEGETFVSLELGAGCFLGNKLPIIGELVLRDCEGKFTTHLVKHLIEELSVLTRLWIISKTTEHVATLDGSGLVFFAGVHNGLAWGSMSK